jgi:hypothetical protein
MCERAGANDHQAAQGPLTHFRYGAELLFATGGSL